MQHITRDSETLPTKIVVDLPIEFPATSRKRIRGVDDFGTIEDHSYDAVNKRYVDAQIAAGGGGANPYADFLTVDGIELAIANLKAPTLDKHASTKKYVDDAATKAMLATQWSSDVHGRVMFKPNVEFTQRENGYARYNAAVVFDKHYGFRTFLSYYESFSNIWINKVTVRASVYIGNNNDTNFANLDFVKTQVSLPLEPDVFGYIWKYPTLDVWTLIDTGVNYEN